MTTLTWAEAQSILTEIAEGRPFPLPAHLENKALWALRPVAAAALAEVERLRAALAKVANVSLSPVGDDDTYVLTGSEFIEARSIAREVLAQPAGPSTDAPRSEPAGQLLRPVSGERELRAALEACGYQRVFNAIGDAVTWREHRTLDISVDRFIEAITADSALAKADAILNPVQDAEPEPSLKGGKSGRTGGAHPPTGATTDDPDVTFLRQWVGTYESRHHDAGDGGMDSCLARVVLRLVDAVKVSENG